MSAELKNAERTEEIQHIIERIPNGFGLKITMFVVIIVMGLLSLGWLIKYPDTAVGNIVINATQAQVRLVANNSGNILLTKFKNQGRVEKGDYIAVFQNETNMNDLHRVTKLIENLKSDPTSDVNTLARFPGNVSLGELNFSYTKYLNAITQVINYKKINFYGKQSEILVKLKQEYKKNLQIMLERKSLSSKNMDLIKKFRIRDSILFSKKVITASENDRSEMTLINARDAEQALLKEISDTKSQLQQAEDQLQQLGLKKLEAQKQYELDLYTSLSQLKDDISAWERKYVFKAPVGGILQYIQFWSNRQYVEIGTPVFSIIPSQKKLVGQMVLPTVGAGKVAEGQEVIIKLQDFPYNEYGSIKGIVSSIGLSASTFTTKDGQLETYLVNVTLPNNLTTNYGKRLSFKSEIKGQGEIITKKRKLIERFFDNLSYQLIDN